MGALQERSGLTCLWCAVEEGRRQATVELLQEMGMEKENVCAKMQEKFQLSFQEAEREVEKYWK